MTAKGSAQHTLGEVAAFQLANVTKTAPQYLAITPRWLVRLLDWKPVEAGTLRLNRVVDDKSVEVVCEPKPESSIPAALVRYPMSASVSRSAPPAASRVTASSWEGVSKCGGGDMRA